MIPITTTGTPLGLEWYHCHRCRCTSFACANVQVIMLHSTPFEQYAPHMNGIRNNHVARARGARRLLRIVNITILLCERARTTAHHICTFVSNGKFIRFEWKRRNIFATLGKCFNEWQWRRWQWQRCRCRMRMT